MMHPTAAATSPPAPAAASLQPAKGNVTRPRLRSMFSFRSDISEDDFSCTDCCRTSEKYSHSLTHSLTHTSMHNNHCTFDSVIETLYKSQSLQVLAIVFLDSIYVIEVTLASYFYSTLASYQKG